MQIENTNKPFELEVKRFYFPAVLRTNYVVKNVSRMVVATIFPTPKPILRPKSTFIATPSWMAKT